VHELSYEEVRSEDFYSILKDYDVFIAGANYRSYLRDGKNPNFRRAIERFLSDGKGFYGVCAGAFLASQGYEDPDNWFENEVNKGVLRIANIYLNDDFDEELQYLLKESEWVSPRFGQIPIEVKINREVSNPIFLPFEKNVFNISYGGGAGMYIADSNDSRLGKIIPLLIYNEELMETKPIHFWKKALIGWIKDGVVKTDIKGQFAGIATTFNDSGRIVLLSSHPEIPVMVNGTIKEFFGRNTLGIPRIVYAWYNGTTLNMSKNWWISRRAVAWLAKVPDEDLPPCNELMVFITKPQGKMIYRLYVNDKEIKTRKLLERILAKIGKTVIIGDITVATYVEGGKKVEFYLDGNLEYVDYSAPFEWKVKKDLKGEHSIEVKAYDNYGNSVWDASNFLFL